MPSHTLLRLLESFFRHRFLYSLPLLGFAALGGVYVANLEAEYGSEAVVLVENQSYLSSLTQVRGAPGGYQTPAGYTSRQLNALLQTDTFINALVSQSGLGDPSTLTADDYRELRSFVTSWEAGENLVRVRAVHTDPEVAQQLAEAAVTSLIDWRIEAEVAQTVVAEEFIGPITAQYRAELDAARSALDEYLSGLPAVVTGDRPPAQQVAIEELTAKVEEANARYVEALGKEENAQVASAQAESDVRAQIQLLDAPKVAEQPLGRRKDAALALGLFLTVGLILSVAATVIGAVADQALRTKFDVERRIGVDVLAVLPDSSAWTLTQAQSSE